MPALLVPGEARSRAPARQAPETGQRRHVMQELAVWMKQCPVPLQHRVAIEPVKNGPRKIWVWSFGGDQVVIRIDNRVKPSGFCAVDIIHEPFPDVEQKLKKDISWFLE